MVSTWEICSRIQLCMTLNMPDLKCDYCFSMLVHKPVWLHPTEASLRQQMYIFFFFFWNLLCILSGLLADTENPIFVSDYWRLTSAPSVLFRVSELAHFPSMLIQSFSTHFGQSPLAVLLYGSHAFGLAVCQRWGACPGSRCIDRPLFHVHLTPWGAVFKLYVFAIEFMLL